MVIQARIIFFLLMSNLKSSNMDNKINILFVMIYFKKEVDLRGWCTILLLNWIGIF